MEATSKWHILLGLPKWSPEIVPTGLPKLWTAITPNCKVRSQQGQNQSCSPRRDLSNAMSHLWIDHREEVDSQLLVVGSQTANLTPGLSFAHNLGCRCPNDQCEAIFDIYVSRPFQWHEYHPECEVFFPLLLSSEHSGVPKDSKSQLFQVLGFTSTLGQSRGATLRQECEVHIAAELQLLVAQSPGVVVFLSQVESCWQDHCDRMLPTRNIAFYLDRTYVIQNSGVLSLWDMGL